MDYKKLDLYVEIIVKYTDAFGVTQDIADYVPEKALKVMYKKLISAMKSNFWDAFWINWRYQRERKKREKEARMLSGPTAPDEDQSEDRTTEETAG